MKAIVYSRFGAPEKVLKYVDAAKPAPAEDEVLVKVRAVSLNYADVALLGGQLGKPLLGQLSTGPFTPKFPILGSDIAGTVEAVGGAVTQFQPGDAVFGDLSAHGRGGLAEYATAPEAVLAHKPANVGFEQAATLGIAGGTALMGLRDQGQIQPGQQVLIHGASGGVGTFAVQMAKAFGAEVTAVCSTGKLDLARRLGADHVIDYTQKDFSKNGRRYDLILGVNGNRAAKDFLRVLKPQGVYVMAGGTMRQIFDAILRGRSLSQAGGRRVAVVNHAPVQANLAAMGEMLAAGQVVPEIDALYPLAEAVAAFRYLVAGHARGKVVITVP